MENEIQDNGRIWKDCGVGFLTNRAGKQELVFFADSVSAEMRRLIELEYTAEVCPKSANGNSIHFL